MQGIVVRQLGPADLALLCAVRPGLFDNDILPGQAALFLADPANVIWLAFDGDHAVGMLTGTVLRHPDKPPTLFVNEAGTRDEYQRRGIARALLMRALDWTRANAINGGMWLGTETGNEPARALYRACGAVEVEGAYYGWDDAL